MFEMDRSQFIGFRDLGGDRLALEDGELGQEAELVEHLPASRRDLVHHGVSTADHWVPVHSVRDLTELVRVGQAPAPVHAGVPGPWA